jgi:hypothetical protein
MTRFAMYLSARLIAASPALKEVFEPSTVSRILLIVSHNKDKARSNWLICVAGNPSVRQIA